jgi:hypothetical protein
MMHASVCPSRLLQLCKEQQHQHQQQQQQQSSGDDYVRAENDTTKGPAARAVGSQLSDPSSPKQGLTSAARGLQSSATYVRGSHCQPI